MKAAKLNHSISQLVVYLAIVPFITCCSEPSKPDAPQSATPTPEMKPVEFIGRIMRIEPLGAVEADLARWRVEAEVVRTSAKDGDSAPPVGSRAVFFVHSVALTFGVERELVVGKSFRLAYATSFEPIYRGEVKVLERIN